MMTRALAHSARSGALREYATAAQPVAHPVDRLPLLEKAGEPSILAPSPTPHPGVLTGPLLELEPVNARLVEYLIVRHRLMVARR
jgi:hypothetical protein